MKKRSKKPFDFITTNTTHSLDQGWSWVIMMAAFGAMFIVIGYQRSFGLLFVAFQEKYDYSSVLLSAVNGAQTFTYSFSTMVVMNYLLKKISVRTSCLIGACIQSAGIIASSIKSDMISLIIFQGVFFGLGHSMLFCPTILIVSQYFKKQRSVATAAALCGASMGGISFPYISRFLLHVFGLEGALLILGALIFNQTVFFALYQPIVLETAASEDKPLEQSTATDPVEDDHRYTNGNNVSPTIIVDNGYDGESKERRILVDNENDISNEIMYNNRIASIANYENNHCAARHAQLSSSQTLGPDVYSESKPRVKDRLYSSHTLLPRHLVSSKGFSLGSKEFFSILSNSSVGLNHNIHSSLPALGQPNNSNNPSLQFLPGKMTAVKDKFQTDDTAVSLLGNDDLITSSYGETSTYAWVPEVMRLKLFWLMALYVVGGIISAGCPALYIPPLSKEKGLSGADATFFLTISAVTDFLGRVGTGCILHFHLIEPCSLAIIPLLLSALFFNLAPLFNDFYSIMVLTLQYGFSSSMYWTLQSLVVIDVLGLSYLGPAMGFYAVISGFTTSVSFPLAGFLHDETGSYASSFHYFGAMSCVAALALLRLITRLPQYRSWCMIFNPCRIKGNTSLEIKNKILQT